MPWRVSLLLCGSLAVPTGVAADDFSAEAFRFGIAPILRQHCVSCHSGPEAKGDVDLTSAAGVIDGRGDGGLVVPGYPDESHLLAVVSGDTPRMPKRGDPLSKDQIALLRRWILGGAVWPEDVVLRSDPIDWWSLRPLVRPALPSLSPEDQVWVRTPIDAFVLTRLREKGLSPSPEVDRRTQIRRLFFDLTGLPPTPREVELFVKNSQPRAYEKLVDRLLASPHYGERWARHWLDVVHYADTHGYDKDKVRAHAWPYRDYVIGALNDDKPYGRFVREQLAGDRLFPGTRDGIVALGFIATGPFDFVGQIEVANGTMEKKRVQNIDRDDMVSVAMNTFVSLTAQCARCHDHKFDPITQEDYYSLQAVFAAVDRADRPYETDAEMAKQRQALKQKQSHLTAAKIALEQKIQNLGGAELAAIELSHAELRKKTRATRERLAEIKRGLKEAEATLTALPPPPLVYAAATEFQSTGNFQPTRGRPRPIFVLERGNEQNPLHEVGPGTVGCVPGLSSRFPLGKDHDEGQRRAALAQWIVDRQNPLTWRSIVNRIWTYHFGRGIVETPNDFGRMGAQPTHPELLDWLAVQFRDGGQSIKDLHRLILNSATYRQSSAHHPDHARTDAGNRFLWRMNRQRLSAEAIRDSMLAVSGKLRRELGGPGFRSFGFEDDHSPRYLYQQHDPDDPASHRRSIYRLIVRSVPDPFMTTLDCADPSLIVDRRNETLTAPQALALLNNKFVVRMAANFADRVRAMDSDRSQQVRIGFSLALQREPFDDELAMLVRLADEHGLANVCRLLFNTNEFVYVD